MNSIKVTGASFHIYYTKYFEKHWNNITNTWKGIKTIISRGVATNSGLRGPGSNRDLFCIVSTNVV